MSEKQKKRLPVGKLIAVVIIGLVVAAMAEPSLLFFLSPAQQQVVAEVQAAYFTPYNPIQAREGGFDMLRLGALALLMAECWAINTVVQLLNRRVKLKSRPSETIKSLLCNYLKYAVVIYVLIFGLSIMGVNMVAVIASLGVLGLVVGFGAQTLIEDVITGLFIVFDGQFHVGDSVTIDGFQGAVTAIGIRTTQITDAGNNIKIINNSHIRTLTNLSEVESVAIADVGISYGADLDQAEQAVQGLLSALPGLYPKVFLDQPVYSEVQELADSAVVLRVTAKVDETRVYNARRRLRELKLCLDRAGIDIPFPQMVVHQG